jgi:hypothetical protein
VVVMVPAVDRNILSLVPVSDTSSSSSWVICPDNTRSLAPDDLKIKGDNGQ